MQLTLSTLPLGILALALLYRSRWNFIAVGLFMSVFQAASILNIGLNGVSASYLLILIGLIRSYLPPGQPATQRADKLAGGLVIFFVSYAIISAFAFPHIFQGVTFTNSKFGERIPLQWETGHLNQLFYLLLCAGVFFHIARKTTAVERLSLINWYVAGNVLACAFGFYQFLSLKTGLPFPSQFLHTNPVYGIFEAYEIEGFARINSTFTEASAVAQSVTPALAITAWRLLQGAYRTDLILAAILLTGLFLSISTTGYLMFGFLAVMSALLYFQMLGGPRSYRIVKLLAGFSVIVLFLLSVATPSIRSVTSELLDTVIFSKKSTISYVQRTQWNTDGWNTGVETYGLGAGWGVCRASSLLPTFFGNIGVPGVTLFFLLLVRVFFPVWRGSRAALRFKGEILLSASVYLVGQFIAGPELTTPFIWVLFAAATSCVRPAFVPLQFAATSPAIPKRPSWSVLEIPS